MKFLAISVLCVLFSVSAVHCLEKSDCKCRPLVRKRILGGWDPKESIPWIASIGLTNKNITDPVLRNVCSAIIVNENYLLTAAHCLPTPLSEESLKSIGVGFGTDLVKVHENGLYEIEKAVPHPKYSRDFLTVKHDVALLKLKRPLVFNQTVQPACFDLKKTFKYDGFLTYYGFGSTTPVVLDTKALKIENYKPSRYLKEGRTQDFSLYAALCVRRMDELICADDPIYGQSFCIGDSGSALHAEATSGELRVIGVSSIPQGRRIDDRRIELCNYGVGVARLSYYADFLNEHMQDQFCH